MAVWQLARPGVGVESLLFFRFFPCRMGRLLDILDQSGPLRRLFAHALFFWPLELDHPSSSMQESRRMGRVRGGTGACE